MTEFEKLVQAEGYAHTVEIVENSTGKTGVANTKDGNVELFFGADDGSDDKTVTAEEFSRDYRITAVISG